MYGVKVILDVLKIHKETALVYSPLRWVTPKDTSHQIRPQNAAQTYRNSRVSYHYNGAW